MQNKKNKIKKNQQGVSILLAVLILSSLTIIVLAVSDVVLRVGRSSRQIGYSEIAYYSAEAGIENALYQIERNQTVVSLNNKTGNLSDISGADWSLELEPIVAESNPYQVQIEDGESFQLELNFQDDNNDLNYPSNIQVSWTGSAEVIVKTQTAQTTKTSSFVMNNLENNLYVLRVLNSSGSTVTFNLNATSDLPIGIKLIATGNYKNEQRQIKVQRINWQIY